MIRLKYIAAIVLAIYRFNGYAQVKQESQTFTLGDIISLTKKESPSFQKNKNKFEASYWKNKSFKAGFLPQASMSINPFTYNSSIVKQFIPSESSFGYFGQSSLNSDLALTIQQNVSFTGGKIFLRSDFARLENFGDRKNLAFNSTPILIGINQPLYNFNNLKWSKIIEKQRFEISKQEYIYNLESIIFETVNLYFILLEKQLDLDLFEKNYSNSKRLFKSGEKKYKLTTMNKAEMLILKMEMIKHKNNVIKIKLAHKAAMIRLLSHIGLSNKIELILKIPNNILLNHIDPNKALHFARINNPNYLTQKKDEINADMQIDKAKKTNGFKANIQASLGFNQRGERISQFYNDLLESESINISITIPIIDWNKRNSEINIATHNKDAIKKDNIIRRSNLEQNILENTNSFNFQKDNLQTYRETSKMATEVYEINRKRFLLGKLDVNNLIISQDRKDSYIRAYYKVLKEYWQKYYSIRRMTLYNFESNSPITINQY
jgi:outer membrane protein TolC